VLRSGRRSKNLLFIAICLFAALLLDVSDPAHAQDSPDHMRFDLVPPMKPAAIFGTIWTIYAEGIIDDDAPQRLAALLKQNGIRGRDSIFLDSPGGSLFAGMKLGRLLREMRFFTHIGKKNDDQTAYPKPGVCLSACALAFLGGPFRYVSAGSSYGVHRFYRAEKSYLDGDSAQIIAAAVFQYIRDMGVDQQLFSEMTQAGPDEMHVLPDARLNALNVVNNGVGKTTWTIESVEGGVYLAGIRDTVWGGQKFVLACFGPGKMTAMAVFDPWGRQQEVAAMSAISLYIDGKQFKLPSNYIIERPTIVGNFWINIISLLDDQMIAMLRTAKTAGIAAQYTFDAPMFWGFDSMDFTDGAKKLPGVLSTCRL
jgi:hypothetical protein